MDRGPDELPRRLWRGEATRSETEQLASGGAATVRALLDVRELLPPGRSPREAMEAVGDVLWSIARRDPAAVAAVLHERAERSESERADATSRRGSERGVRGDRRPTRWDERAPLLAWALGASHDAVAVAALQGLLTHPAHGVRASAIRALTRIGTPTAIGSVPLFLRDRSDDVRWAALEGVDEHLPDDSEALIREYLTRTDLLPGGVRIATRSLVRLESRALETRCPRRAPAGAAVVALVRELALGAGRGPAQERLAAGGAEAVRAVLEGFDLPIPAQRSKREVRDDLDASLQLIALRDLPSVLAVLREGGGGAGHLGEALHGRREDETVGALVDLLATGDPYARWSAVRSLSQAGAPAAVKPLLGALTDPSLGVRVVAVEAVCVHRPAGAAKALRNLLRRDDLVPIEARHVRAALAGKGRQRKGK